MQSLFRDTLATLLIVICAFLQFVDAAKSQPISKVLPALLRYLWILIRYNKIIENPSNGGIAAIPFLAQSSKDFITNSKLEALNPIFLVRQFGYGPFEDFPAIHLLRTVPLSTLIRTIGEQIPLVCNLFERPIAALAKSGTQGLFKKMASELDRKKAAALPGGQKAVLEGEMVMKISKGLGDNGPLNVKTNNGDYQFDKVICAVPPNIAAKLVDFPPDLEALMMKTQYDPYFVGCIDPDHNLARAYYQNQELNHGDPVQFSKRWEDSPIVAYGYNWKDAREFQPDRTEGWEYLDKKLQAYCKANMMINSYEHLPDRSVWQNYHPHVPIEMFQAGYFDKLEAHQGNDEIYLTGDGMAAESMEYSCKYSKQLVEKYF